MFEKWTLNSAMNDLSVQMKIVIADSFLLVKLNLTETTYVMSVASIYQKMQIII